MKAAFLEQVPDETKTVMARATEDLRASGIMDGIPQVGSRLPDFELPDTDGNPVRSVDLRASGPMVLTIYRGAW